MKYRVIDKPAFDLVGKSKKFTNEEFFKKAPGFWKEYVHTEEYLTLWGLTNGKWGNVTEAPLMSVYLPEENGKRDSFTDILGMKKPAGKPRRFFLY